MAQPKLATLPPTATPHRLPGYTVSKFRILYVEDNPLLRESIGELMEQDGREIVLCANGEEALAACHAGRFDLVVTDVNLPGISGTELARRLLAQDASRWIAICSGYVFGEALGVLGPNVRALEKPFEIEDLESLIEEVRRGVGGAPGAA